MEGPRPLWDFVGGERRKDGYLLRQRHPLRLSQARTRAPFHSCFLDRVRPRSLTRYTPRLSLSHYYFSLFPFSLTRDGHETRTAGIAPIGGCSGTPTPT